MSEQFETVIGLECHVELATATKMFCGCINEFGARPNTHVCAICLGHPGTLPVPNEKAIEYTIKIGLALDCEIAPRSLFHRKNYFYPDMPKNYQISQYDLPLCINGHLDVEVDGDARRIGITRVHLEEDTGKTAHAGATGRIGGAEYALEDYNRAGVPLVEVVSEPDMRTPEEARAYFTELRGTLEALGVSDVRMEEGSLRCDANISVRVAGDAELGTKVEIKNLNSIRSIYQALRYEQGRQIDAIKRGEKLIQETRHWEENRGVTSHGRSKEYAFDYRYFPEPDLAPIEPDPEWIEKLRAELPELPAARRRRFEKEYGLDLSQAVLVGGTGNDLLGRREDRPPGGIRLGRADRGDRRGQEAPAALGCLGARERRRPGHRGESRPRRAVPQWERGSAQRAGRPSDEEDERRGEPGRGRGAAAKASRRLTSRPAPFRFRI